MYTTPVRKWKNGRYGNNHWFKYSPKIKRNVNLYSNLEYDHWILIENDPNVIMFCEQPYWAKDVIEGEIINTIFDMWLKFKDGSDSFVEIKYESELDPTHEKYSNRSVEQVNQQKKWCFENGKNYELRSEQFIYKNKLLLQNYKTLLPYVNDRKEVIETDRQRLRTVLKDKNPLSIAEIEALLKELPQYRIRDAIYNMIYEGAVGANLDIVKLGHDTEVWLK